MIHNWAVDAITQSIMTGKGIFQAKKFRLALVELCETAEIFPEWDRNAKDRWAHLKKIPKMAVKATLEVRPVFNGTSNLAFEYVNANDFSTHEGFTWDTIALLTRDNRVIWSSFQATRSFTVSDTLSIRCPVKEEAEEHWNEPKFAFSLQF